MTFKTSQQWELGQFGETQVRRWYQEQNWFVVPVSLIETGGAPALSGLLKEYVLPDIQIAREGEARWVEVKTKTKAPKFQKTGELRHGVDLLKWFAYLAVEHETGLPGYLSILQIHGECGCVREPLCESPSPLLLLASFAWLALDVQIYRGDGMPNQRPMAWFRLDRFDRFPVSFDGAPPNLEPQCVHSWEANRRLPPRQELMPW